MLRVKSSFERAALKLKVVIDGKPFEVEVEAGDEYPLEHSELPPIQSTVLPSAAKFGVSSDFDESKVSRSPLAGVVSRIVVSPGDAVQRNQLLLVLDAMKMEIKISAQVAGTVKSIEVAPGDAVKPDQILISFE